MAIIGLSHYNLRADRQMLEALRIFYVTVIGLTVGERPPFERAGAWLYAGKRDVLHLSEAQADEQRSAHVLNTFHHIAFSCRNRPEFELRLNTMGIAYTSERVPLTNFHQLFCSDPAGNGVELNFNEPSS